MHVLLPDPSLLGSFVLRLHGGTNAKNAVERASRGRLPSAPLADCTHETKLVYSL